MINKGLVERYEDLNLPAAARGPLAKYTYKQLYDLRKKGLSNADIARVTGSTVTRIGIVIGTQPSKTDRDRMAAAYNEQIRQAVKSEPVKIPAKQQLEGQIALPISEKKPIITPAKTMPTQTTRATVRISAKGFVFEVNMDNMTLRIKPTDSNWITIPVDDLDNFYNAIYDVKGILKGLGIGGKQE